MKPDVVLHGIVLRLGDGVLAPLETLCHESVHLRYESCLLDERLGSIEVEGERVVEQLEERVGQNLGRLGIGFGHTEVQLHRGQLRRESLADGDDADVLEARPQESLERLLEDRVVVGGERALVGFDLAENVHDWTFLCLRCMYYQDDRYPTIIALLLIKVNAGSLSPLLAPSYRLCYSDDRCKKDKYYEHA